MKRLTRNEIAKMAKVSPSTVSRALSGSPLIPEATAARIRLIAGRKGYVPNLIARRLASRRTWQIGFAMEFKGQRVRKGPIQMGYYSGILDGLISAAHPAGYTVSVQPYESDSAESARFFTRLHESRELDGLVFAGLRRRSRMLPILKRNGVPMVLVGAGHPSSLSSVGLDFSAPYRRAMSLLSSRGVRGVVFIAGDMSFGYAVEQRKAIEEAARDAGVALRRTFEGDYSMRYGYSVAAAVLKAAGAGGCAIFANDRMAAGFYRHCHENGVGIPSDIRVLGCDKDPISAALFPSLSTVVQPRLEMGREAFRLLEATMEATAPSERVCLGQEFLPRDSI